MLLRRLVAAGVAGLVLGAPSASPSSLDAFIASEKQRALQGVLANIGSTGSLSQGAKSGVVIASPSTVCDTRRPPSTASADWLQVNPNYLYTWTRDSALTLKMVVDEFIAGDSSLESTIKDYIEAEAVVQTVTNPSGTFSSGAGLGEPKFNIDLTRFNGPWGRPQRDGPALRSIALMSYVNYLVATGQSETAKEVVWPIVSTAAWPRVARVDARRSPTTSATSASTGTRPASTSGKRRRARPSSPSRTSTGH